ncbi:ShlB/FhaC/HecB family hemolysin secretion/activation protein [Gloeothece verrucosa]|uniref:Polypeptide-transport-associated domain protein ShlB-type n=1 Tax=Gloeothece verrucosa (strain PCC 7822) TaxID=497965 RepID=E0UBW8_GLOV7|nr:POTRA domain-containing protein [Gloeothece verrucosa]ADN15183.1 Polypeptide-transport-associated domain protein ShlB-type [Gloeothece verrucosa PCC 7822]
MVYRSIRHWIPSLLLLPLTGMMLVNSLGQDSVSAQINNPLPSFPRGPSQPDTPAPAPSPLPPPDQILPPSAPSPLPGENFPSNIPGTIRVKRFDYEGNTAFSDVELDRVTQQYTNRPISFAELLEARTAVTQLYVNNGYVTSGAYIPPQAIENGVVKIQIVEGSLEQINVKVEGKLTPSYVRDRIAVASGPPLNVNRLLEALQLLQLNPIIKRISAELSAGTRPGTSILDVNVAIADTFTPEAIFDNGRNPRVGSERRGIQLSDTNLIGFGDNIQAWYLNTEGTDDVDAAYTIPVNPYNGAVRLEYRNVTAKVIEQPFDQFDITSDYQKFLLSFRQPILQTPQQEIAVGLGFDHQKTQTRLFGVGFPTRGTNNRGRTNISTLRFFQEATQRNEQEVLAARSEFSVGVDIFDTTEPFDQAVNRFAPGRDYFIWRGQGQWVRLLAPDTLFVIRSDIQLASNPLVSIEQFSLGGLGNVVGYRQNYLLTDNGYFGSVEVRLPIYRARQPDNILQIVPFATVGGGWNIREAPNPTPGTIASIGLGLQWQYSDYISARIDWGIKLVPIRLEGHTLQDNGIVFSFIFRPF